MSWEQANDWAASLTAGGISGWRLPSAMNFDGSGPYAGTGWKGNELGHLVFEELGNPAYGSLTQKGPFTNLIQGGVYWLANKYMGDSSPDKAWVFDFAGNQQRIRYTNWEAYGLAVHEGNISPLMAVPEPSSYLLCAMGLAFIAHRTKVKRAAQSSD